MAPGVVWARTARRACRSGVLWGYVFGISVASTALSYSSIYKTRAERLRLAAAFGANHATIALFGPAPQLQTVGGFTVLKVFLTLTVVGAVWGLLGATRLMRGEEDAGRWELLLSGGTTRRAAAAQAMAGLGAGLGCLFALTALITVVVGRSSKVHVGVGAALYFALTLTAGAVMFSALGALTSQLAATRRQAAAYAAWVLGVSYALRLVADAGAGLHALVWVSPLGWTEELRPLTGPHPVALVPIAAFTVVVATAAVALAGRRDLGAGVLPDRDRARPRLRLLGGQGTLVLRLGQPTLVAWVLSVGVTGLLFGLVAKSAGATISGSSVRSVFAKLGAPGAGTDAYLGVTFLILAVLAGFVAGGQMSAARAEEAEGRATHLLARPVARPRWYGTRLATAAVFLVVIGVVAGLSTWLGAASQDSGVGLGALVGAGLNIVPPAAFVLGAGALTMGLWPRATSPVVYAVVGWSLLVDLVGGIGALNRWVLDTSLFHQMAAAPAVSPHWVSAGVMVGLALAMAGAGTVGLARRDLRGP